MVVGVLHTEVYVPLSQSLKDKRAAVRRLKDQVRSKFNVAVAEIEPNELWQRATVGIAALGEDRGVVEAVLRDVAGWLRSVGFVELIRLEEEYF